jgi:hypothetical protein
VDVEDFVGDGADGVDDEGADGDVRHKTSVHHVDMHPIAAGLIDGLDLWVVQGTTAVRQKHTPLSSYIRVSLLSSFR